ncbi:ABC transporter substrate-binding protein [Alteribacillus sp. HJP-4]|uniref:ABC transporter substrate-binding protein n=1 Tax=Alteribacillus sp. HJP-4 TaxID=2775394 RepID=UPI0035CCDEB5
MRSFKKSAAAVLGLSLMAAGCSNSSSGGSGDSTELSIFSTITTESEKQALEELIEKFEEENEGIQIDMNFPGPDYESLMRTKMAANDMPDLFDTHGWAKTRYKDYVADLSEEEWSGNIDEAMDPVLRDEEGKLYAMPLNQAKDGISYNATLLEEYGIEPPETFAEFEEALATIEEKGKGEVTPLWMTADEAGSIQQYFDQMATPLLVTDEENNHEESLMDGTFDWSNYTLLPEKLKEFQEKGYLNEDLLTAGGDQATSLMAQNQIGFIFASGAFGADVTKLAEDVKVGLIPVPAVHEGDDPSWIGGERHTLALNEESENPEEAKAFLEFMAEEENAKAIAEATSLPSAFQEVESENYYSEYFDAYAEIEVEPYFDRVYLPSGMWDVFKTTGEELLSNTLTPNQVSTEMESEYLRLREEVGVEEGESIEEAEEPEE